MFGVWTQLVDIQHLIYWQGQCVCDALFCLAESLRDLPHHSASCHTLGVFEKLSMSKGCIDLVWKCLAIRCGSYSLFEPFSQWKLNNWHWKLYWNLGALLVLLESPYVTKLDLIEFISQSSELRCGRYWFLSGFCCWKFKNNCKNWVGKEKLVEA